MKDKPTLRGRRVEGFGQTAKADTSQSQFLDGFDQLLHRARQAVSRPGARKSPSLRTDGEVHPKGMLIGYAQALRRRRV
jgi:hypothetical protein